MLQTVGQSEESTLKAISWTIVHDYIVTIEFSISNKIRGDQLDGALWSTGWTNSSHQTRPGEHAECQKLITKRRSVGELMAKLITQRNFQQKIQTRKN